MKLYLSEKQATNLMFLLHEDDAGATSPTDSSAGASTSTGSSSPQSGGGSGYPEVTKWESGIQRGAANQVGITKWSDVVGSKLNRGKANPLNEQPEIVGNKKVIQIPSPKKNFYVLPTPVSEQTPSGNIAIPKIVNNIKTTASYYHYPLKYGLFWGDLLNTKYEDLVPSEKMLQSIIPDNSLQSFTVGGVQYTLHLERTQDNPLMIRAKGYLDKNQKPFIPPKDLPLDYQDKSYWERLLLSDEGLDVTLGWIAASVILAILTEGASAVAMGNVVASETAFTFLGRSITNKAIASFITQAGLWSTKGLIEIAEGKKEAGLVDILIGTVLPLAHEFGIISRMGIGKVSKESVDELAIKVIGKNETELIDLFTKSEAEGGLSQEAKDLFVKASSCSRKIWSDISKEVLTKTAQRLKGAGVNLQTKLGKVILQFGDAVQKRWILSFSFMMMHDSIIIDLIKSTLIKFGVDLDPMFGAKVVQTYSTAKSQGKENEFTEEYRKALEKSGNIKEFENNFNQSNFMKNMTITKSTIDSTEAQNLYNQMIKGEKN